MSELPEQAVPSTASRSRLPASGDRVSESALVAAIPIAGYIAAYAYECGVADAFGFPRAFIELSPRDLILATIYILPLVGFVMLMAGLAPTLVNTLAVRMAPTAVVVYVAVKVPITGALRELLVIPVVTVTVAIFLLLAARDIARYRKLILKSGKKGLDTLWLDEPWIMEPLVAQRFGVTPRAGARYGFAIALLLLMNSVMPNVGGAAARLQTYYLASAAIPSAVIFRRYNDFFVVGEVDRNTRRIGTAYRLVPIAALADSTFRHELIGPLSKP
jgi:hypothetical protein